MEERTLRVLEFHQFLQTLKAYASSEMGRTLCLSLRPFREKKKIENLLQEVNEASDILKEKGDIPLEGAQEVRSLLHQARAEGACLLPEDLLRIKDTLGAAHKVKQFLSTAEMRHPHLQKWGDRIPEFQDLYSDLNSVLGPRGEILDSASPELRIIRKEISKIRTRIHNSLTTLWGEESYRRIFQEQIITLRNDRYVLAVKAEFRNTLPGIIHDQSQSKATFFIEPLATVAENNELNLLLKDEKEEERRILLHLTSKIREKTNEIYTALDSLGGLDLIFAKAKWAQAYNGTAPLLNREGRWNLKNARHPLLEAKSAVPIELRLEDGQSTLIITGANTGGKTVALKTLGLLTLMAQCGIPIPASEGSEVAVFNKIFADIGDEQSLQENLSTFSAWILTVSKILKESDESSLILLDEVGGGTDPTEGAALTMALLDAWRSRGAKTAVTTHLHLVKAYGAIHPDVVNVSVEFNPDTLRSTYRLIYGRPGESHALLMAEKWGFSRELIDQANTYLGEGDRKAKELLISLERTQQEMEAKCQASEQMKQDAEKAREKALTLLHQLQEEKEMTLLKAREEANALVLQAKEELRKLINEFKEKGQTDVHHLGQGIRAEEEKIRHWDVKEGSERLSNRTIPPGWKFIRSLDHSGQAGKNSFPEENEGKRKGKNLLIHYPIPSPSRELKVIGLRVEEALPLVEKALDEAFLGGLKELDIIHGAGTGRLRKAIREQLKEHAFVKTFLPGGPGRGGDGVTVVEIGPAPASSSKRRSSKEKMERS